MASVFLVFQRTKCTELSTIIELCKKKGKKFYTRLCFILCFVQWLGFEAADWTSIAA